MTDRKNSTDGPSFDDELDALLEGLTPHEPTPAAPPAPATAPAAPAAAPATPAAAPVAAPSAADEDSGESTERGQLPEVEASPDTTAPVAALSEDVEISRPSSVDAAKPAPPIATPVVPMTPPVAAKAPAMPPAPPASPAQPSPPFPVAAPRPPAPPLPRPPGATAPIAPPKPAAPPLPRPPGAVPAPPGATVPKPPSLPKPGGLPLPDGVAAKPAIPRPGAIPPPPSTPLASDSMFDLDEEDSPTRMVDASELQKELAASKEKEPEAPVSPAAPPAPAPAGDPELAELAAIARPTAPPPPTTRVKSVGQPKDLTISDDEIDAAASVFDPEAVARPTARPPAGDASGEESVELSTDDGAPEVEPSLESRTEPPPASDEVAIEAEGGDADSIELDMRDSLSPPAAEEPEASVELSADSDDAPAIEGDDGPSLEGDDGPEFVTEDDDETTISIEESEEEEVRQDDRGALLAATVTSRRRDLEDSNAFYTVSPRAEAEHRCTWLATEASLSDDAHRAGESYAIAAEIVDGVLGDQERARALYDTALGLDARNAGALRGLRRMLAKDEPAEALALADREVVLDLSEVELSELESYAAELAARVSAGLGEERWDRIAEKSDARGALAKMLAGGSRKDTTQLAAALDALGHVAQGSLAAALNLARARLAEGAAEAETALAAVREAVQRDPADVGSWLAMARVAIGREDGKMLRAALAGISKVAGDGASVRSAVALDRSTAAVLSDSFEPVTIADAGVDGWLVAHALRDVGHDDRPQVDAALAVALNASQLKGWQALSESETGEPSAVGQLFALRRAAASGERELLARAAADAAGESELAGVLRAALTAEKGSLLEIESGLLGEVAGRSVLTATLASVRGGDAASEALGESPWSKIVLAHRAGSKDQSEAAMLDLASSDESSAPVRAFGAKLGARYTATLEALADALKQDAAADKDRARAASTKWLAAAIDGGLAREGAADQAIEAAEHLTGDAAAAELVSVFGLRGEVPAEIVALSLESAAGSTQSTPAERAFAVRAALRRGGEDPAAAADSLYSVWNGARSDGALAVLLLRSLAPDDFERRASVLREMAERAQAAGAGAAQGAWLQLAGLLEDGAKPQEAAQAISRARAASLEDPALKSWEESLWLRAGMFEEVAERAFDALKSATDDAAKVRAYDRLAELDSTFRGDVSSAVLTYQAILELAPGHAASLRTLERYFVEQGRTEELLGVYDKLIKHIDDSEDASAIAHAAARAASVQAEGDVTAGAPFVRAAFARGAFDDRLLWQVEGEARRAGDAKLLAEVAQVRAGRAEDAREKASQLARASEALAFAGDAEAAATVAAEAVTTWPNHPSALLSLANIRKSQEQFEAAAEALETYALVVEGTPRATASRLEAGILWQDKVGDASRARDAFDRVLEEDPAHAEAFPRALKALEQLGDTAAERQRIEARLARDANKDVANPLRLRASAIAEQEGDNATARQHLRAILAVDEAHQDALRGLIRLSRAVNDWASVADATIRLARHTQDNAERTELLYSLGEAFDDHLNAAPKAETAYKRVMQMAPEDKRPIQRLADLYARLNNGAGEAEMLQALLAKESDADKRKSLRIRLAAVLSEKLERGDEAEATLSSAREEAPTDLDVLRAFARLYMRLRKPEALAELLDNAAGDMRAELDGDLQNAELYDRLADILKLRGRLDGAKTVAAVAHAVGAQSEKLAPLSTHGTIAGAGVEALSAGVMDLLAPPAISSSHRELLRLAAEVLERLVPFEPGAMRAEKLGARPHPLRAEVEKWARLFGIDQVEIFLGPTTPLGVLPVGRHPAAVMIPVDLGDTPAARFAVGRAMTIVALSLPLFVRLAAPNVTLLMGALARQFDPMFTLDGVDMAKVDDLARRITRVLPRPRHAEMAPHAFALIERRALEGEALAAGTVELANRIAVLAGGDVGGAVAGLLPAGANLAEQLRAPTQVGRIVRVVLSDRFLEARHITGADRSKSSG
ncbi:MAG: hypothetical protein U0269_06685 [Polyangiales bacterium]